MTEITCPCCENDLNQTHFKMTKQGVPFKKCKLCNMSKLKLVNACLSMMATVGERDKIIDELNRGVESQKAFIKTMVDCASNVKYECDDLEMKNQKLKNELAELRAENAKPLAELKRLKKQSKRMRQKAARDIARERYDNSPPPKYSDIDD